MSVSFLSVCTSVMAGVIVVYLPSSPLVLPIDCLHLANIFLSVHCLPLVKSHWCELCVRGWPCNVTLFAPFVRLSGLHQARSLVNSCLVDSLVISGELNSSAFLVYLCGSKPVTHGSKRLVMQTIASFCLQFIF